MQITFNIFFRIDLLSFAGQVVLLYEAKNQDKLLFHSYFCKRVPVWQSFGLTHGGQLGANVES